MKAKIVKPMEIKKVEYVKEFRYKEDPTHGFFFACDRDGNIMISSELALKNYMMCLTSNKIQFMGVVKRPQVIKKAALGVCPWCGEIVILDGATRCKVCGSRYDENGFEI